MNLREAAQLALEALEEHRTVRLHDNDYLGVCAWCYVDSCDPCDEKCTSNNAITALRAALAEPTSQESRQVEPVAWRTFDGEGGYDYRTYEDNENYAADWAQRNPRHVGWVEALYTAPPKRKPLTDWEIEVWAQKPISRIALCRAVERAHEIRGEE